MLFASDLDQTLIYSYSRFGHTVQEDVRLIEELEGRQISFIGENALTRLKDVAAKYLFVPVTTRTIEQYRRISIFQAEIVPKYVVTSNGGSIFKDGNLDQQWSRLLRRNMDQQCLPLEDVIIRFSEIKHQAWVLSDRIADDLFYYCTIDRATAPDDEISSFKRWVNDQGWETFIQGRKLYLIPKPVNKKDAVLYIKQKEGHARLAASGDSLLDLCMLECADLAISPIHGEIHRNYCDGSIPDHSIRFTTLNGIGSAEEILKLLAEAFVETT